MNLGKAIKEIRKVRGIRQKELAAVCDLSANAMCNIENGLSFPTQSTIEAICNALAIPQAYLLLSCIEESDMPVGKEVLFRLMVEPLKRELFLDGSTKLAADNNE